MRASQHPPRSFPRSPFASRAYGGFTRSQEKFVRDLLGAPSGKTVLDPMAGQAYSLSRLASEGATVYLGDLNPAPLLLASLRDPHLLRVHFDCAAHLSSIIDALARRRRPRPKSKIVVGWIAPEISRDLIEYSQLTGLGLFAKPFSPGSEFLSANPEARFAAAIAVLAARELACFRTTDNVTWLKPGGLLREDRAVAPLRRALETWCTYARGLGDRLQTYSGRRGAIHTAVMDVERNDFGGTPQCRWIVTSPPYANRLDYTRLWAPETEVLATMCEGSAERLQRCQIGTTVVEGRDHEPSLERELPAVVRNALTAIRSDRCEYSDVYYYPFFRNYAISLMRALRNIGPRLKAGGTAVVFVRDTVRKDVLFPTGELVTRVLTSKRVGLRLITSEHRVIRHHIGFLRKSSASGVFGLAQQEWWLAFQHRCGGANGRAP